jgi:hypothetical protein
MSVLYQPPLKNAIRKARTIFPATARSRLASGARSGTYGIQSQAADRRFWHPFHLHFAGKRVDAFTRFRAFNTSDLGHPLGESFRSLSPRSSPAVSISWPENQTRQLPGLGLTTSTKALLYSNEIA